MQSSALWLSLVAVAASITVAFTQQGKEVETQEKADEENLLPDYPRVNLATWYEVDPGWPKKPADFQWEAVPGVAVDANDHVYVFTRSNPPVQVYDRGRGIPACLGG